MESKRVIKFFMISKLFENDHKQLQRGENAYNSGHIKNINFFGNLKPAIIKGQVHASMKNKFYDVEISLNLEKEEIVGKCCSCPRGVAVCHHMAALLYSAHYNISPTDSKRAWGITETTEGEEIKTIEELFGHQNDYKAIVDTTQLDKNRFQELLGDNNVVGFSWLLRPEADQPIVKLTPAIEDIIFSEEFVNSKDRLSLFGSKCCLSHEQIVNISEATVGQNKNENWLIARKHKLTASKFGLVLKACKRNRYPPSLFKSLLEGYDLEHVRAIEWGMNHEETAISKFVEIVKVEVIKTGLWLDPCGFLGASPDGLINEDALLEIKCPYKMRNDNIKDYISKNKYFFRYEDDHIVVDPDHAYYHQVQGQLHITKRQKCYFFVWTPSDYEVFVIERDDNWVSNISTLKEFYLKYFLQKAFDVIL